MSDNVVGSMFTKDVGRGCVDVAVETYGHQLPEATVCRNPEQRPSWLMAG